jgi:hypothetical protein
MTDGASAEMSFSMAAADVAALSQDRWSRDQKARENRNWEDVPHGHHPAEY